MNIDNARFYNDHKAFGFVRLEDASKDAFVLATALERAGIDRNASFDPVDDRRTGKIAVTSSGLR